MKNGITRKRLDNLLKKLQKINTRTKTCKEFILEYFNFG
jgi:hypothetical protein